MFDKIEKYWASLSTKYKYGLICAFVLALSLLADLDKSSEAGSVQPQNIDTYIPEGHVLVPIEVENYHSLDSVLGPFGVVDLYALEENGLPKKYPVVRQIKIMRSPQKPEHFAVLAPENQASRIMSFGARFHVVVQNPKAVGTKFEKQVSGKGIQIVIEDEK